MRVLEARARGEIIYPRAYLYRTARNLAFKSLARQANWRENSLEEAPGEYLQCSGPSLEDSVTSQQRFESLCKTAALLPRQCRKVLILRKVYGKSQQEVAQRMGIAVSTVEKHLAKALHRCAQQLEIRKSEGVALSLVTDDTRDRRS